MLLQVAFLDERLVTVVALVRPYVVVELLVESQVRALLQFCNKLKHHNTAAFKQNQYMTVYQCAYRVQDDILD